MNCTALTAAPSISTSSMDGSGLATPASWARTSSGVPAAYSAALEAWNRRSHRACASHDSFSYAASKAAVSMLTLKYANAFRADPALADAKVNAVTPGCVTTDRNGFRGVRTTEQGARASVQFATLGVDGPSGGFFDDEGPMPW